MTINKGSFGTSGYGADIFLVGGANSPFTNYGNLTTSGDFASALKATADGVTITNKGNLTTIGDGSYGIFAGDVYGQHYDNVTVVNYGTITTSGDFLDDGVNFTFGADGIELNGNNGTVINRGSITTLGPDSAGIGHIGANSTISNYGTINSEGIGIVVDTNDGTEINNTVVNYGQIHTTGDGSWGIYLLAADNVVKNLGSIQADGFHSFGISMEGDSNHAENYGMILATGEQGRGVLMFGGGHSLNNYGHVDSIGTDGVGVRIGGDDPDGLTPNTFTNYGEVTGAGWAVLGWAGVDQIVNHGKMTGAVDLGGGNDSYVAGKGGSLSGALTLGDGNDLIIFEKGGGHLTVTDFVAGAGTDDVFDLSGFGYASFADVMSHASQSGADVVLKLGGKDMIVLDNVSLASLKADDFTFASSPLLQTAATVHVPLGDYLFA